jgi:ribosomal protein L11 methyltransferase
MFELKVRVDPELSDALSGCLFEAGAEGVEERDDDEGTWVVTYAEEEASLGPLAQAVEEFRARVAVVFPDAFVGPTERSLRDDSWQQTWLSALEPAQVTDRFVLRPLHRAPAPEGESTIWFEPDACFGSGSHPTTRMAAQAVQSACEQRSQTRLLDVGSGSGVLCFVALRASARSAVGIDVDSRAVENSRRNAELNELSRGCVFETTPLQELPGEFDVVVANIDAPTLRALAPALAARLAPGGELFVTGLLDEQEAEVAAALQAAGLAVRGRAELGEWVLLALGRA